MSWAPRATRDGGKWLSVVQFTKRKDATAKAAQLVRINGSLAVTFDPFILSAAGVVQSSSTLTFGSLSSTLGAVTGSSAGTLLISAASNNALGEVFLASTAQLKIAGALAATLSNVTSSGSGSQATGLTAGTIAFDTSNGWVTGQNPPAIQITLPSDGSVHAGHYYQIEFATNSGFTTGDTTTAWHQISSDDVLNSVETGGFTFDWGTTAPPSGAVWFKLFFATSNTGASKSAASNVITDTLGTNNPYTSTLNPVRTNSHVTLSNGNLTALASDTGGSNNVTSEGQVALTQPTGYFEATLNATGIRNPTGLGVWDGTYNTAGMSSFSTAGKYVFMRRDGYYNSTGTGYTNAAQGSISNGGTIGVLVHKATGKVWFRMPSGWVNGTPAFNSDQTIAAGSTGGIIPSTGAFAANILPFLLFPGADGWTMNFGASAFVYTVPTNATPGWR